MLRNIGIFAHVDAGKTTLSEQLLAHAGAIRQVGSVDAGTAHTDSLPVEQRRGISVKAKCVRLNWRDTAINLIDTPGHVDFSAEVERSLWALDGAVLVVSAAEGVQPQTETLFEALREQGLPIVFFLNKLDREGADIDRVIGQIHRLLTPNAAPLNDKEALTELVCGTDDALLERYVSGETFESAFLKERMEELSRLGEAYPILAGSALRDQGIEPLLDAMISCLPSQTYQETPLCGVIFAAQQDRLLGRGVWVRLYSGCLQNREAVILPGGIDPMTGEARQIQRKITQIRTVEGADAGQLTAGEIGVIYGLGDAAIGHVLGEASALPRRVEPGHLREPLLAVQALPEQKPANKKSRGGGKKVVGDAKKEKARDYPASWLRCCS